MMTTESQSLSMHGRLRLPDVVMLIAPVLGVIFVAFLLQPVPRPGRFLGNLTVQSTLVLAPLAVALSGRLSWGLIWLRKAGLKRSLALGTLYALIVLGIVEAASWLGLLTSGSNVATISNLVGVPLAVVLYLPFWGVFESVWMCYLIYAASRWPTGGDSSTGVLLFLAALLFGLLHTFAQLVLFRPPLPQALGSV